MGVGQASREILGRGRLMSVGVGRDGTEEVDGNIPGGV